MAFIEWSDKFCVNVKELDEQHKTLFDMVNVFYDSLQSDSKKALQDLLDSLAEYTMYHFRTEEKYFDKFKYANSERHKSEHQDFVDKVLDTKRKIREDKIVMSIEITNFIKKWIQEHVAQSDKKYSKCFNDHGLF